MAMDAATKKRLKALEKEAAKEPEAREIDPEQDWTPKDGDDEQVSGQVLEVRRVDTQYGEKAVVDIVLANGTKKSIPMFSSVLADEFDKLTADGDPQRGDLLSAKYHGERKSAQGRTYSMFTLKLDRLTDPVASNDIPDGSEDEKKSDDDEDDVPF